MAQLRTIEVQYKEFETYTGTEGYWVILGGRGILGKYDNKKAAVHMAKEKAKDMVIRLDQSVGVKIFGKEGEYQRQHVYDP